METIVRILSTSILFSALLAGGAAMAQGGGGGGSASTNPEIASCTQRGADGKPVRKMSSEEVCPMFQFWREDCERDVKLGLVSDATKLHCEGLPEQVTDGAATGSTATRR